jgi:hypothetical protein
MHVAPECLGPWRLRAEAMPLSIDTPVAVWVTCVMLIMCTLVLSAGLMAR